MALSPLTMIAGSLGSGLGGLASAGITDAQSQLPEQYRKQLSADYNAMIGGRLGLTEDQKRKQAQEAADQAGAAISAQEAGMARMAMGGQNPMEGQFADTQAALAGANASAASQATASANQFSEQLKQQQREAIMGSMLGEERREDKRIDAARERGQEMGGGLGTNIYKEFQHQAV